MDTGEIQARPPSGPEQQPRLGDLMRYIGARLTVSAGIMLVSTALLVGMSSSVEGVQRVDYYPNAHVAVTTTLGHVSRLGTDDAPGCSALVLSEPDPNGHEQAVAALTATHCEAINPASPMAKQPLKGGPDVLKWILGSDGQKYLIQQPDQTPVQTGVNSGDMTTVGTATEVLVATDGDTDQALLVLKGHSEAEALALYDDLLATPQQLANLTAGDTVQVSGWPEMQNGDGQGHMERQDFDATFIARGTLRTDTGENMQVVWLAFPRNSDGATCFHGLSGAVAFTTVETPDGVRPVLIGTTYGPGYDYTDGVNPTDPNAHPIAREYPNAVDWSRYATVCAMATTPLQAGNVTPLRIVNSRSQIPSNGNSLVPAGVADIDNVTHP